MKQEAPHRPSTLRHCKLGRLRVLSVVGVVLLSTTRMTGGVLAAQPPDEDASSTTTTSNTINRWSDRFSSVEDFEEYIWGAGGAAAEEEGSLAADEAQGNLFFNFFSGIWVWLQYFFGCTLGVAFLGPTDCVCLESALRTQVEAAANLPGSATLPLIALCPDRVIGVSREMDVTDRAFILTCRERGADCRISGRNRNRLFAGAPAFASFFDVQLRDGNAADNGGLLRLTGGTTTLARSALLDSAAVNAGGALYLTGTGTTVNLLNCTLANNRAGTDGGAIAVDEAAAAVVQFSGVPRSRVFNNRAGRHGGGIAVLGGSSRANAVQTEFYDNAAESGHGGCLFLEGEGAQSDLGECYFEGNRAEAGSGGAVWAARRSRVELDRVSFVNNEAAAGSGGALAVSNSRVELDPRRSNVQVGFRGNAAAQDGNDIAILDDEDPAEGAGGSNVACRVVVPDSSATVNRILFCDGIANGIFEAVAADGGGGAFDNTNCDTEGQDGALAEGNIFCL